MLNLKLVLAVILVSETLSVSALSKSLSGSIHQKSVSADLANALAQVAYTTQTPMLAELAQPLPHIYIAEGTYTAAQLLDELARQARGYGWETRGSAIYFFNRRLRNAQFNPLTRKFSRIVMPSNVSELKYMLPNLEATTLEEKSAGGVVMTGFGDETLKKDILRSSVLENISGEDVVFQALGQSPTFALIVVFSTEQPTKEQALKAFWAWQSFKAELRPVYGDTSAK